MIEDTSDVDTSAEVQSTEDPIRQLKGEFSRKHDATSKQLESLQSTTAQLSNLLQQALAPRQAPKPQATEDLNTLMYSDPARFAQLIEERAEARVMARVNNQNASMGATNNTLQQLTNDYPELQDHESALSKKAASIFASMDEEDRKRPMALRLAVKEAASEMEIKPRSKRPVESFAAGNNGYGAQRRREPSNKISEETKMVAELLELDISDPAVNARMLERAKRDQGKGPKVPVGYKGKKGKSIR